MDVTNTHELTNRIKAAKEELIALKGFQRSEREKSAQVKEKIKALLSSLSESDIDRMEMNGIYVRELLMFDIDKVTEDPEMEARFKEIYNRIVRQIMELVDSKLDIKRSEGA